MFMDSIFLGLTILEKFGKKKMLPHKKDYVINL